MVDGCWYECVCRYSFHCIHSIYTRYTCIHVPLVDPASLRVSSATLGDCDFKLIPFLVCRAKLNPSFCCCAVLVSPLLSYPYSYYYSTYRHSLYNTSILLYNNNSSSPTNHQPLHPSPRTKDLPTSNISETDWCWVQNRISLKYTRHPERKQKAST